MLRRHLAPVMLIPAGLLAAATSATAQHKSPRHKRMMAVEQMLESRGDEQLREFARRHLAPAYRESLGGDAKVLAHLRTLRQTVGATGDTGVTVQDGRVRLHLRGRERKSIVAFTVEPQPPHRITELVLERSEARVPGLEVTWETLEATLDEAARDGFCGSVLAVRDGEIVLDRGYGHADPERRHRVTPDTLFAIGSTPIDFTHGAILKLAERGELSLDDAIAKYFDGVPEDKRGITLDMLRTGRSGLMNFPGIAGVDENMDLSWIDRAEFLRRVFASELLFPPGTGRRHSHCAWGVLAAVVEVVTGKGYEEFLRETFFEPAGMKRTGHYPLARSFPSGEVAIGLGGQTWGEVNSPAHWGETSWLVLGSGGMVSTPRDLRRWRTFLATEAGLGPAARAKYGLLGVFMAEGGNDRGFINTIGGRGDDLVIVCSNSHVAMDDDAAKLAQALARVATRDRAGK